MSNPISPSGSPVPPQEPPKKQLEPSEKETQQDNPANHPASATPETGLRDSPLPEATPPDTQVQSRSVTPATTREDTLSLLERIDRLPKAEPPSLIFSLSRVMLLHDLKRYEQALHCLDEFLDELPQDHPLYSMACFWRGHLLIAEDKGIPLAAIKSFELAQQHHFAGAIPFLMAINSGIYAFYSQVKWRNCQKVIRLLDSYANEKKIAQGGLANYIAKIQKTDKTEIMNICCMLLKTSTDSLLEDLGNDQSTLSFMVQLCKIFTSSTQEDFDQSIQKLERWLDKAGRCQEGQKPIFDTYKYLLFALDSGDPERFYQPLHSSDASFAQFSSALIRIKQFKKAKDKQKQRQFKADVMAHHLKAAEEMPMAFDALGEFLISINEIDEAMKVYERATIKINDFLAGKTRLFGYSIGENAEQYRKKNSDSADEVDLDELSACEEMLRLFEAKHFLCEMARMEKTAPAQIPKISRKKKKKKSQTPEQAATVQSSAEALPEPGEALPPKPPVPPKNATKGKIPKPAVKDVPVSTEPSASTYLNDYNTLLKANQEIHLNADYEEGHRLLNNCSAPKNNPLWFKKRQHMAWLYLKKSQDDKHLMKFHEGPELIKARNELQKKARKEVRSGLNKLIKICRPDNQTDVLEIPVVDVMQIARELGGRAPGFRTELGSLYSTMGHILKAERDRLNPRTQQEQCKALVRQANQLFQLAHRILGKRLS